MKFDKFIALLILSAQSFFFTHSASAEGKYVLVSDIDDTVKITHVVTDQDSGFYHIAQVIAEMIRNGFNGKEVFLGMSELYQELSSQGSNPTIYLSGSPQYFTVRVQTLFRNHAFPEGPFFLNNWMNWQKTQIFKNEKLANIEADSQYGALPFLLVGDDTESDPYVLTDFRKTHPERTLNVYIHQVVGRVLPEGAIPYSTAFDVALHEIEAGRLNAKQVQRVGQAILEADKPELLFPYFVKVCPKDLNYSLGPIASANEQLVALSYQLQAYIRNYCTHRFIPETIAEIITAPSVTPEVPAI